MIINPWTEGAEWIGEELGARIPGELTVIPASAQVYCEKLSQVLGIASKVGLLGTTAVRRKDVGSAKTVSILVDFNVSVNSDFRQLWK